MKLFLNLDCILCIDPANDYEGWIDFKCLSDLKVEEDDKKCEKFL